MTATEKIIRDAIEGGFMKQDGMVFVISNKEMFYVDQENPPYGVGYCRTIKLTSNEEKYLLMPTFWRAVGRTRGWKVQEMCDAYGNCKRDDEYLEKWHQLIDHLVDGLTIEEALSKLD